MSDNNIGNRNPNDKQKTGNKERSPKPPHRPEPARPAQERQPRREDDEQS